MKKDDTAEVLSIEGREVRVTHPDKPYFSKQTKLSKLDPSATICRSPRALSLESGIVRWFSSASSTMPKAKRSIRNARPPSGPHGCELLRCHSLQAAKWKRLSSMTRQDSPGS